jgi:hypothetical protein
VQAGGGKSDEDVAGLDGVAGDEAGAVDDADDEAGEVVFAIGVEAGHLRGLASDEGASAGVAGLGDPADDFFRYFWIEKAGGKVVKEEQRGRALDGDVVYAVVDEVAAHGVVDSHLEGELELGADAVSA